MGARGTKNTPLAKSSTVPPPPGDPGGFARCHRGRLGQLPHVWALQEPAHYGHVTLAFDARGGRRRQVMGAPVKGL